MKRAMKITIKLVLFCCLILPAGSDVLAHDGAHPSENSAQNTAVPCSSLDLSRGQTVIEIRPGATGKGEGAFGTYPLTISPGTTVVWKNDDTSDHELHTLDEKIDTGLLKPGECFSATFMDPGAYRYHCHIHGMASESGEITVQAAR